VAEKFEMLKIALERKDAEKILNLVTTFLKDENVPFNEKPTFFTARVDKNSYGKIIEISLFYSDYRLVYTVTENNNTTVRIEKFNKKQWIIMLMNFNC